MSSQAQKIRASEKARTSGLLRVVVLLSILPALADVPHVVAATSAPAWDADLDNAEIDIWNDPTFKKQFIAYYGINSDVEPYITQEEIAILEKVRPLMAQDLPKAEVMLRGKLKPDSSAILDFTLGGIQFQQDNMPGALASYLTAVEKFPSFRRAWRNLGLIYVRDQKNDDAIKAFTRMIELGGGDAYSYGLLGFAYAAKQDYQPSEAAFQNALLLQPDNNEWRLGMIRAVFRQQKYEDAITLLEVMIERYPDNADFWMLQAQAFLESNQPLRAAENLEALDRMGKSTVSGLQTLGDIYITEDLMDLASRAFQKSIDVDTTRSVDRPLRAAEVLAARGAVTEARAVAAHIQTKWKGSISNADRAKLLKLEARLSMADGTGDEATAKVLQQILEIDPLDGEALMLLGQHYARNEKPDKAIFYYERAQSLEDFEVIASIRHAQVLMSMERYADAIPLIQRAQDIKPNDDVARYLEQVQRIAATSR